MFGGVELKIVGYVRVEADDEFVKANAGAVKGVVEILPAYEEALDGVENYSHLFIISILHKAKPEYRNLLKVKPRRLLRLGFREEDLPTLGVFSTDSPVRPNPLGLTLVKLTRRDGRFLHVEGLDLFDGTPVVDVKPYRPDYRAEQYTYPDWVKHDARMTI
ncbi:MAG: tRNA (N6-threonylcarbamoyladenosine(37)-N6)-methyltransferase TrmO [Candidatus Caldarchaeum sp.]|nr:tRNA (N6-threonylcarbamoyladenosine(37)-N6)-methyltransferase TrmO [Candidatus Caldarchaeum sp.]